MMRTTPATDRRRKIETRSYRTNLAKGQTGCRLAFDLRPRPATTRTPAGAGRGRQGRRTGPPYREMRSSLDDIPPPRRNTSMTIDAVGHALGAATDQVVARNRPRGHARERSPPSSPALTQNDIVIKEVPLPRDHAFPAEADAADRRLIRLHGRQPEVESVSTSAAHHLQVGGETPTEDAYVQAPRPPCSTRSRNSGQGRRGNREKVVAGSVLRQRRRRVRQET